MEFLIQQDECLLNPRIPVWLGSSSDLGARSGIPCVCYCRHVDCPHFSQGKGEEVETGLD
jgi:hypothetical protein